MTKYVWFFNELKEEQKHRSGGKGATLARLFQKGYPVPNGFVIQANAFDKDRLIPEAMLQIQKGLMDLRQETRGFSLAVRSSALCEDSHSASYAGQFDTILNVSTEQEIFQAIDRVHASYYREEVKAYSNVKGINQSDGMAIVVQMMVPGELSGVLFTVDPISKDQNRMVGNFILGLGDKLVSGQVTPFTFTFEKRNGIGIKGIYDGPPDLKPYAHNLYQLGCQLEQDLGGPQDIEWSIAEGNLYLLQSRPITTLSDPSPATGEWNDSLKGDYLWTNVNFGEGIPEVMTPITWSVQKEIFETWKLHPGVQSCGNIGGRIYLNLSNYASVLKVLGKTKQGINDFLEGLLYTKIPKEIEIPLIPLPGWSIFSILKNLVIMQMKQRKAIREFPVFLASNPKWCGRMQQKIRETNHQDQLISLWNHEIFPHLKNSVWSVMGSLSQFSDYAMKLRRELIEWVGPEDADTLLSGLSTNLAVKEGSGLLASLGPVVGIGKVSKGEIDCAEYIKEFGHRGPNEFELSVPRPGENPEWLDKQLEMYKKSPVDVEELLCKKRKEFKDAWNRLQNRHPGKVKSIRRRLDQLASRARMREAVRSEYVRDRWVARTFVLQAGQLTGLQEDIYYLSIEEILSVLSGDNTAVKYIPARKEMYHRYASLPAYPPVICGAFDPFLWVADPNCRKDVYDSHALTEWVPHNTNDETNHAIIKGSAGSAGRVEGVVCRVDSPDEGAQLMKGEILVTSQTDIAWTPLFPRAAAIVTDVGAPLSHAAIVARELGIPAVVGCRDATAKLHTGDRVFVDGGQGIVKIIEKID